MAGIYEVYREFSRIGSLLYPVLNNSHSGNLSIRDGNNLIITRTGTMSSQIGPSSLIKLPIDGHTKEDCYASSELPLHRATYRNTGWQSIVHTHPPVLIALSMLMDRFTPIDEEGKFYNPEGIKVITAVETIGSQEIADKISTELKSSQAVLLRGHGLFVGGKTLEEAAKFSSSSEHSAKILQNWLIFKNNLG
jgi:L-fuculose-phosphate aldolase